MDKFTDLLGVVWGIAKAFRQMQLQREHELIQANIDVNYVTGILRGQAQTWDLAAQWIEREIVLQTEINGINLDDIPIIDVKAIPF